MNIRIAKPEDFPAVFSFICELEETAFDYNTLLAVFLNNIYADSCIYLVAEDMQELIGFISCHSQLLLHHSSRVAEIHEFYVKSNVRSTGVGTLLLKELRNQLRLKDIHFLEVTAQNKRAQTHSFYLKNGFTQSHEKFTQIL